MNSKLDSLKRGYQASHLIKLNNGEELWSMVTHAHNGYWSGCVALGETVVEDLLFLGDTGHQGAAYEFAARFMGGQL